MIIMFRRRGRKPKPTAAKRFFRSIVSIVILTAFVLGISLFVKEMAYFDPSKAVKLTAPLWDRLGVSQETVGDVAGSFAERLFKTNIAPSQNYKEDSLAESNGAVSNGEINTEDNAYKRSGAGDISSASSVKDDLEIQFKVAMISDSQNENESLSIALKKAGEAGAHSVFFLGDYTAWGSVEELAAAKKIMDDSGLVYYSLPGDHDLGQSVGPSNYNQVFSDKTERVVEIKDVKFVMLDNSANKTLISEADIKAFKQELAGADFVLLSQPLYHYAGPSVLKPIMGFLLENGELKKNQKILDQSQTILSAIRDSGVKAIISGDHHSFSISQDPVRSDLMHVAIGSVTQENAFRGVTSITTLNVYNDGSYSVVEVPF